MFHFTFENAWNRFETASCIIVNFGTFEGAIQAVTLSGNAGGSGVD